MADMTDDELLAMVSAERRQSIGFDHDDELASAREKALNYFKGEMPDVPALPNRSKAVSTDIADATETLLPDLIEIFTGGDDVATFRPVGEEDEEGAQQETDYVNHVVFNENNGFLHFYTAAKDALLEKTGVFKFWWEDCGPSEEVFKGKSPEEMQAVAASAQQQGAQVSLNEEGDLVVSRQQNGKVCIGTVAPDDFTVGRDTIHLRDATYCAMRSRPRIQDLVREGYDRETVSSLPLYGSAGDDTVAMARDTAGEHDEGLSANSLGDLRQVEVIEHYLRLGDDLWKVVTGANEATLIDKEKVEMIPFAAITPYLTPHRFYGRSVADLLTEIQRIKTALTRMALDSGYFALNQRLEVNMEKVSHFTISDLLRNEPGVPIRTKGEGALKPIASPGLSFDAFGALEYFSTVGEQRTGIVRNAQGLNPDTLHDTAKGALALMTAAQKRVRLIARIFAETGIKDLFLGVHALVRTNATQASKVRLRNKWVDVDPTAWGERKDMTIEIGLGSGGRDHELAGLQVMGEWMDRLIQMQGGPNGPIVTLDDVHKAASRLPKALGFKGEFFSDPKDAPPQEPKPDPEAARAQADAQVKTVQAQLDAAANEAKAARKHELDLANLEMSERIKAREVDGSLEIKRYQIDQELILRREELAAEFQLKGEQIQAEQELAEHQAAHGMEMAESQQGHQQHIDEQKISSDVRPGGEPG